MNTPNTLARSPIAVSATIAGDTMADAIDNYSLAGMASPTKNFHTPDNGLRSGR